MSNILEEQEQEEILRESHKDVSEVDTSKATTTTLRLRSSSELLMLTTSSSSSSSSSGSGWWQRSPTLATASPPLTTLRKSSTRSTACTMWIHLQASICTEWEQNSMVLNRNAKKRKMSTKQGETRGQSSLLKTLSPSGLRNRPKTIHRCILQRSSARSKPNLISKLNSDNLVCHVCSSSYPTYALYLQHLIDTTCIRMKSRRRFQRTLSLPNGPWPTSSPTHSLTTMEMALDRKDDVQAMAERSCGEESSVKRRLSPTKRLQSSSAVNNKVDEATDTLPEVIVLNESDSGPLNLSRRSLASPPSQIPALVRLQKSNSSEAALAVSEVNNNEDKRGNSIASLINKDEQRLPLAKKRSVTTRGSSSSSEGGCCHEEVRSQPPLTLMEHVEDENCMARLKTNLTTLLVSLLGEQRLTHMGYPDKDILQVLHLVLVNMKATVVHMDESKCECDLSFFAPGSLMGAQRRYRQLRRELQVSRTNVNTLLQLCLPNVLLREEWSKKNVEEVIQHAALAAANALW